MKQLLQNLRTGETSVANTPIPTPQTGQALIRNAASLVSAGTERMLVEFAEKSLVGKARSRPDLVRQVIDKARREGLLTTAEAAFNRLDQPMPLGYSSAGTIAALGEGMPGFKVGQRVACAGGGYAVHAEYAVVPRNLLAPIPDEVDFESAAFATLGAIALHGFRLAETQIGEKIAVIGLGLLGLLTVGIAKVAGCQVFGVDLDKGRVAKAQAMGATAVEREFALETAASFSRGRGCDAVLICADTSSSDPIELAGAIARDRARVVATGAVGLNIPRKVYYEKELTFLNSRSYGPGRYDPAYEEAGHDYPVGYVRWTEGRNLEAIIDLLASIQLDVSALITHRFPIEQAPQAYQLITGKTEETFLGVLLTYPETVDEKEIEKKIEASSFDKRDTIQIPEIPETDTVRLGVLGAGNFATAVMLPAIQKITGVELVGIVSASGMSARHAAKKFGFQYADSNPERILTDSQINTVAILTRHHLHAQQVLEALSKGKHVFCEKPLALSIAELDKIEKVFRDDEEIIKKAVDSPTAVPKKPLLMVGFNRRFAHLSLKLKDFLAGRSEPLVAHYRVNAGYLPPNHWTQDPEQGGGRMIGEGCHFIDFLTFLVGESPVSVHALALPDNGRYNEDNIVLTLRFRDGSLGTLSYLSNGDKTFPKEMVDVFCGGRVAVLNDYRSLETIRDGRRKIYRSRLRQDKGHKAEWEAYVNAIQSAGPPPIPYSQLFGVSRASLAAVEALRSGETIKIV